MSNGYAVFYSREASEDLRDIKSYIERIQASRETARRQLRRIRDAVRTLEKMPMRHPVVQSNRLASLGIRRMNVGGYAILYSVDEEGHRVNINRIVYGRRNL